MGRGWVDQKEEKKQGAKNMLEDHAHLAYFGSR